MAERTQLEQETRSTGEGRDNPTAAESWAGQALADAEDGKERRPGRPKGSRDRRPRKKAGKPARPASDRETGGGTESVSPDAPITDAELSGTAKVLGVAWRLAGSRLNRRPLSSEEELELATAAVPVMRRYGGDFLERWGAEITLGVVVVGLWQRTRVELVSGEEILDLDNPTEVAGA